MTETESDRIRALRWQLKRQDTPARRQRCRPNKQAAYRDRIAAGRRVFHLELDEVDVEEMLCGLDALPEGFTRREADEALAQLVTMLCAATGNDMRFRDLLATAIEIFESRGT